MGKDALDLEFEALEELFAEDGSDGPRCAALAVEADAPREAPTPPVETRNVSISPPPGGSGARVEQPPPAYGERSVQAHVLSAALIRANEDAARARKDVAAPPASPSANLGLRGARQRQPSPPRAPEGGRRVESLPPSDEDDWVAGFLREHEAADVGPGPLRDSGVARGGHGAPAGTAKSARARPEEDDEDFARRLAAMEAYASNTGDGDGIDDDEIDDLIFALQLQAEEERRAAADAPLMDEDSFADRSGREDGRIREYRHDPGGDRGYGRQRPAVVAHWDGDVDDLLVALELADGPEYAAPMPPTAGARA